MYELKDELDNDAGKHHVKDLIPVRGKGDDSDEEIELADDELTSNIFSIFKLLKMSKLQRMERMRELAREYTEALMREGLDRDLDVPDLPTQLVAEALRAADVVSSRNQNAIEYGEMPLPRGALPRTNVQPAVRPVRSANDRFRLKEPSKDATVLPLLTREERRERLSTLINILRLCPTVKRADRGGCFNCGEPHSHRECPYRRGTFCGRKSKNKMYVLVSFVKGDYKAIVQASEIRCFDAKNYDKKKKYRVYHDKENNYADAFIVGVSDDWDVL
ncbi:hypothetical protein PV327_004054 [Microctonus hyperodae]|uniref:Uncharacterized protein n=1 Tax=Microctonus hyperodae TaxID=165561 RepID=A0AA39FBN2_MICHY|nr:hypothetical protein PV327_004054 [Microctonus hyperodae]